MGLLAALAGAGLRVPRPIPTPDGRLRVDGVILTTWLDGDPPASDADWRSVGTTLDRLHALGRDRGQRPGFASATDLLTTTRGGDIDLDGMPPDVVATCRLAWAALPAGLASVVHGDPGATNVRLWRGEAGLMDWDEARVDLPLLDLIALPLPRAEIARLAGYPHPAPTLAAAHRAALAWEVANGWTVEPAYTRRCLARLLASEAT
ncbi:MAG: phosphotransferase [Thermomicrobiales bacterium]